MFIVYKHPKIKTMIKKFSFLLILSISLIACDPADLQRALDTLGESTVLSDQDVSLGLKEALNNGVSSGVDYLSAKDGFYKSAYKILLPEEAQMVIDKLKIIPGFDQVEDEINRRVNQAAENAVTKAQPIFVQAVRKMTFKDVWNILMGEQNAATTYLHKNTYSQLFNEFEPVVVNSLNQFGALDYWTELVTKYNALPFVKDVNPKLEDHITNKALDGLFDLIEKKELGIRTDIKERPTDLLRRVFAKQDK